MISSSLGQHVALVDSTRDCLYTKSATISYGDLCAHAQRLRNMSAGSAGGRIALCGLAPQDFIVAIAAFDGTASTMLLLPDTLAIDLQEALIQAVECTHRLDPGQNTLTSICRPVELSEKSETRWLLVTSGTTGTPKIVEHSFFTLSRTVKSDANKGREYHWGLMYDSNRFAGLQVVLQALLSGSRLTLPGNNSFHEQVQTLADSSVNALSATPSMWRKLLMDGRVMKLNLRQVTLGGEIVDQSILDALRSAFPRARITHIYASTEAGTGFAVNDGEAGFPAEWLAEGLGPIPLRVNNKGHLLIKPPVFFRKSAYDQCDFFDTEDLVRIEGERVFFLGRASGVINVGGNKVNPEYIEQIIRVVSGVQDVKAYPKKSSLLGQLVVADIVAAPHEDTDLLRQNVLEYCRDKLDSWQVPAKINFVSELNINATGKLERTPK